MLRLMIMKIVTTTIAMTEAVALIMTTVMMSLVFLIVVLMVLEAMRATPLIGILDPSRSLPIPLTVLSHSFNRHHGILRRVGGPICSPTRSTTNVPTWRGNRDISTAE